MYNSKDNRREAQWDSAKGQRTFAKHNCLPRVEDEPVVTETELLPASDSVFFPFQQTDEEREIVAEYYYDV